MKILNPKRKIGILKSRGLNKMYDETKVKKFNEHVVEEYNEGLIIEDIVKFKEVTKIDDDFTQIGLRPLMEDDFLVLPNFDPRLPGVGRMVAAGETDFLIDNILNNEDVKKIEFKEDIKEFPKYVFEFNNAVILISTKFYVEIFTKLIHRIDYGERHPRLDYRYRIIPVPEKVLGNKIIIIDKNAILWEKEIFENKETGKKEKLDIKIKSAKEIGKVDILIRSVNKMKIIDPELIRILEVGE